ncbi:MAG TPA: hypothetical protein VGD10_01760 [Allosphingosinicella sp.]|uniref:hypothetical protein n=1 Tax=Allosphingosinicella sp. TaxID=2823234 RepID=UPI002ED85AEE
MRIKSLSAALAASALMLAPAPAMSAASSLSIARASASTEAESEIMDSGFMGVAIVFGLGAVVGALLYSVIKGGDDDEPASP